MDEVKTKLFSRPKGFQRLYSGYGIEDSRPSEEFWQSLWEDKPRICLVDLIDMFRVKKEEECTSTVNSFQNEFDVDFTNSKQFSLGKWQKNDFFKLNKCSGAITCSRHAAHMKHHQSFDTTRLQKSSKHNLTRKSKQNSKVSI